MDATLKRLLALVAAAILIFFVHFVRQFQPSSGPGAGVMRHLATH